MDIKFKNWLEQQEYISLYYWGNTNTFSWEEVILFVLKYRYRKWKIV